ncbi:hypothetical protein LJR231_001309 [Phyllobacterium sp. LjRoot231]|uniref:hypothetical protein n=1 Tax=Phyllobacterium sp. LjRoot231 TaxID=3342289 RepID=UPI003ED1337D
MGYVLRSVRKLITTGAFLPELPMALVLRLNADPLKKASRGSQTYVLKRFDYLRLEQVETLSTKDVERLPFIKRVGFTAEEEYRIIAQSDEPQRTAFSIDMPLTWINKIYLNPWLPDTISESVKATLRSFPGCSKLPVQKSRLIDSGRWKKAGDKVVGRSVPSTPLRKKQIFDKVKIKTGVKREKNTSSLFAHLRVLGLLLKATKSGSVCMSRSGILQMVAVEDVELDRSNPRIRKFLEMYGEEPTVDFH